MTKNKKSNHNSKEQNEVAPRCGVEKIRLGYERPIIVIKHLLTKQNRPLIERFY
mgnify:CR=1 FL=1